MDDLVPNQLFVAGYSRSRISNERDVKDIFRKYGNIKEVVYKGSFAFVTFSTEQEAQEALQSTSNQMYNGQRLKVSIVDNRRNRRQGPSEGDACFKCGKGGHWARDCPNMRSRSPRRRYKRSHSKSRHRRRRRSRSYSDDSSSRSRRKHHHHKKRRYSRSRSPRRDRRRSTPRRRSPESSLSSSRRRQSSSISK